jgi:hypothetical protein
MPQELTISDSHVLRILERFRSRSINGYQAYGKTLDRTDLSKLDWLNHLQEELMDSVLYIEKLKTIEMEKMND